MKVRKHHGVVRHYRHPSSNSAGTYVAYTLLVFVLSIVCAFCCRWNPRRRASREVVARWKQKLAKQEEERIESKITQLKRRLKATQLERQVHSAKAEEEVNMIELTSAQDERGRALYGEAWDQAVDGNVPLKDLFSLDPTELKKIKIAAYAKVLHDDAERSREEETGRRQEEYTALHPLHAGIGGTDHGVEETKRPTVFQAPGLRKPAPPPMPPPSSPPAPSRMHTSAAAPELPRPTSSAFQAPGLRFPAPPPMPPPIAPPPSSSSSQGTSSRPIPTHGPPGLHSARTTGSNSNRSLARRQRRTVV